MRDVTLAAGLFVVTCLVAGAVSGSAPPTPGDGFHALTDRAMDTMMTGMDVKATGNVDHDFVAMMVAHHQGAIDMAVAELKYGHDEHLKRIAQEIIVDQQQEIAAMRLALGQPLPPSAPTPTTATAPHAQAGKESP
jgi:hypothetical protein